MLADRWIKIISGIFIGVFHCSFLSGAKQKRSFVPVDSETKDRSFRGTTLIHTSKGYALVSVRGLSPITASTITDGKTAAAYCTKYGLGQSSQGSLVRSYRCLAPTDSSLKE